MKIRFIFPGILLLFMFFISSSAPAIETQSKPNILFLLTDDQRWDSLGCYGNKIVKTPHLDKLAAGGVRLNNFYVASPFCCPSRGGFLTGVYPHQSGVFENGQDIPEEIKTVADYLNNAGYVTGFNSWSSRILMCRWIFRAESILNRTLLPNLMLKSGHYWPTILKKMCVTLRNFYRNWTFRYGLILSETSGSTRNTGGIIGTAVFPDAAHSFLILPCNRIPTSVQQICRLNWSKLFCGQE